jgi:hypothetical protein
VVPSLDEIPGDVTSRRTIHHHVDVVPVAPANVAIVRKLQEL